MLGKIIKELLNILLGAGFKDAVINIFGETAGTAVEKKVQQTYFCLKLDDFIKKQADEITSEQLETIFSKIKKEIWMQISNCNLDLIDELKEYMNNEFVVAEIPQEFRNGLRECLIQYIMFCISKKDKKFFNELLLNDRIQQNEDAVIELREKVVRLQEIINTMTEMEAQSVIMGSHQLHISNVEKVDIRRKEIEQIEQKFQAGSNVVFLCGRPGIGKTTLAKLYANRFCEKAESKGISHSVYFVSYEKSIENSIAKLSSDCRKYQAMDILAYWNNMEVAERKKILLIIDNFNEDKVQGSDKEDYFKELSSEFYKQLINLGIQVLFTTRINVERDVYKVLPVENPFELFERYVEVEIKENEKKTVKNIIRAVQSNTMLIVLSAHIWRENGKEEREKLLAQLENCSVGEREDEIPQEADAEVCNRTIYGQAEALLDFSGILKDVNARVIFADVSLLPLRGMDKKIFLELVDCGAENALNALIRNSWILEEDRVVRLHPMVKEIVYRQGICEYRTCYKFCENVGVKIQANKSFSERIKFKDCAWEIFKQFGKEKQLDKTFAELFYNLSDICDEIAQRSQALELVKAVYNNINVYNDDLLVKAGRLSGIAYSWNNYYKNMEDLEYANKLLDEAKETVDKIDVTKCDRLQYAKIYGRILSNYGSNNIAKAKCSQKDEEKYFTKALHYHNNVLEFREHKWEHFLLDENEGAGCSMENDVATSYNNIATTHFYLGQYEKSIANHLKAYQMRKKLGAKKLMNDNQQRIIGSVIELYRRDLQVEERYLQLVLDYYPELLKDNYTFYATKALKININYFNQLAKIILNNRQYSELVNEVLDKRELIMKWMESDVSLKEEYGNMLQKEE